MKNKGPNMDPTLSSCAIALEESFHQFERLSQQLEQANLDSESGLAQAQKILAKFGEQGDSIAQNMQILSQALEQARARAEVAAALVTTKAAQVQLRQARNQAVMERFHQLKDMVKKVTTVIAELNKAMKKKPSVQELGILRERMPELDEQLEILLEESRKVRENAQEAHMTALQKNISGLVQGVQAARRQLKEFSRHADH